MKEAGCEVAQADLQDPASLARVIANVDAIQVIIPIHPETDDSVEYRSIDSVVAAFALTRPRRILAISDYGAHIDRDVGMPSIFREFERRLGELGGQVLILRPAEHLHNWGRNIPMALASGKMPSFQNPVTMEHPTIAAQDLGNITTALLRHSVARDSIEIIHAEGPRRYSAVDVANALSELSGRHVDANAVPVMIGTGRYPSCLKAWPIS